MRDLKIGEQIGALKVVAINEQERKQSTGTDGAVTRTFQDAVIQFECSCGEKIDRWRGDLPRKMQDLETDCGCGAGSQMYVGPGRPKGSFKSVAPSERKITTTIRLKLSMIEDLEAVASVRGLSAEIERRLEGWKACCGKGKVETARRK